MTALSLECDTIAAISTAPGRSALAVVRMSGSGAFAVASKMLRGRLPEPGTFAHRRIFDAEGRTIDDALVLVFSSPRSYTGEDSVEFQCHGGGITPSRVLSECIACGARLAQKGEFTFRAVMAGKIGLDEAESILDLIDARTCRAADDALAGIGGERRNLAKNLYSAAIRLSAEMEHALDVQEEELPEGFFRELDRKTCEFRKALESALENERRSKILRDGVTVVLAGPPNSGKSSLMNALLGESRAIVSPEAGTTRDTIEAWLDLDGFPVRLIDTAGVRDAASKIEAEGVRRALESATSADIVIEFSVPDGASPQSNNRSIIHIHSKCDISRGEGLNVSSVTGEGLDDLKAEIEKRISEMQRSDDSSFPSAYAWSLAELDRDGNSPDLVIRANTMRRIGDSLSRLAGADYSSDMLDALFSRFCVGK